MPRPRRIKKEDIGDPSNFVHIQHVGFGKKASHNPSQASIDGYTDQDAVFSSEESSPNAVASSENDQLPEQAYKVERRNKGYRSSQIPRHHRSTTTCTFPAENQYSLTRGGNRSLEGHRESIDNPSEHKVTLKPTFGSLLNLSFLPLGLGKSSSKSPSIGKTKRMSLLNLTASNLFASPKASYEENRESVHMTGYVRRRSFSNSNDDNANAEHVSQAPVPIKSTDNHRGSISTNPPPKPPRTNSIGASTRIPLAKLGRSKSSMADFSKRPKLRLKITAPPVAPPPVPQVHSPVVKNSIETEALPSPPPSPLPSPPPSPVPTTTRKINVALRSPKSTPRPRIIPLPSTSSVDSVDPPSPQYLTPAGGSSPQPNNESTFPVLSPTMPPSSTPFFTPTRGPGTPPVWPLQPLWPNTISMQIKEPTIPEIPSPCHEEMETSENEYAAVLPIVESFISVDHDSSVKFSEDNAGTETCVSANPVKDQCLNGMTVTAENVYSISSVLQEHIDFLHWPCIAQKLFQSIEKQSSESCKPTTRGREMDIYANLLTKTLELWSEKSGNDALVEKLVSVLAEENHSRAIESLHELFRKVEVKEDDG